MKLTNEMKRKQGLSAKQLKKLYPDFFKKPHKCDNRPSLTHKRRMKKLGIWPERASEYGCDNKSKPNCNHQTEGEIQAGHMFGITI